MSAADYATILAAIVALLATLYGVVMHAEADRLRDENTALREDNLNLHWATIPRETVSGTPLHDRLVDQRLLRDLDAYCANPVDSHLGEQP